MDDLKKKNIYEYDAIRLIATILVVIGHSVYTTMITQYGGIIVDTEYGSIQNKLQLLVRLIYSFHMPLFIALSGALYEIGRKNRRWSSFKELLINKIKRLMVPFCLTTIFWLLPLKYISGYYSLSVNPIRDMVLGQIILFDNCHLWYLVSLFWIFIIVWIIDKLFENEKMKLILFIGMYIIGCFFSVNVMGIQRMLKYTIYFYAGMKFERKREKLSDLTKNEKIFLANSVVFGAILLYFIYLFVLKNNEIFYGIVAFGGIGIIYVLVFLMKILKIKLEGFLLRTILKNSFGIYLYSDPINYIIILILINTGFIEFYQSNLFCVVIFLFRIVMTTMIAIAVQWIINKIKSVL